MITLKEDFFKLQEFEVTDTSLTLNFIDIIFCSISRYKSKLIE